MYTCTYDLMYQERPFLMGRSPDWEARDLTLDLARLLMCRDPKQVTFSLWTTLVNLSLFSLELFVSTAARVTF